MKPPTIERDHVDSICKPGLGEFTCRYLVMAAGGMACAKHIPAFSEILDRRVAEYSIKARGDNCRGILPAEIAEALRVSDNGS
jgi:hypothetical protein